MRRVLKTCIYTAVTAAAAGALAMPSAWGAATPPWRVTHVDSLPSSLNVVAATGPGNVWAAGFLGAGMGVAPGIVLLHWNGQSFTRVKVPYQVTGPFSLTGDGAGGCWLSATEYAKTSVRQYLYHDSRGHWTRVPVPNEPKNVTQVSAMAAIPGTHSVWAAGAQTRLSGGTGQPQAIILKYGP